MAVFITVITFVKVANICMRKLLQKVRLSCVSLFYALSPLLWYMYEKLDNFSFSFLYVRVGIGLSHLQISRANIFKIA